MNITTVTVVYAAIGFLAAAACHWRLARTQDITAGQLHCWTLASIVFIPWFILYVLALVLIGLVYTETTHQDTELTEPDQPEDWVC
jgi:L-asparagine transporter-like permease